MGLIVTDEDWHSGIRSEANFPPLVIILRSATLHIYTWKTDTVRRKAWVCVPNCMAGPKSLGNWPQYLPVVWELRVMSLFS